DKQLRSPRQQQCCPYHQHHHGQSQLWNHQHSCLYPAKPAQSCAMPNCLFNQQQQQKQISCCQTGDVATTTQQQQQNDSAFEKKHQQQTAKQISSAPPSETSQDSAFSNKSASSPATQVVKPPLSQPEPQTQEAIENADTMKPIMAVAKSSVASAEESEGDTNREMLAMDEAYREFCNRQTEIAALIASLEAAVASQPGGGGTDENTTEFVSSAEHRLSILLALLADQEAQAVQRIDRPVAESVAKRRKHIEECNRLVSSVRQSLSESKRRCDGLARTVRQLVESKNLQQEKQQSPDESDQVFHSGDSGGAGKIVSPRKQPQEESSEAPELKENDLQESNAARRTLAQVPVKPASPVKTSVASRSGGVCVAGRRRSSNSATSSGTATDVAASLAERSPSHKVVFSD
uniref:BAG domain-containing protein n=1 Tax=Macrostomum lignano TaxID=282301 RepID=A0A1I8JDG3_9PLAT